MRRLLRKIEAGEIENLGDTSTLASSDSIVEVQAIMEREKEKEAEDS